MVAAGTRWTAKNFVGGHPSLDFVNTAGGQTRARDTERLVAYADAVRWALVGGLLNAAEAESLLAASAEDRAAGERALRRLRAQREALHAFLLAGVDGVEAPSDARARVEADLRDAYGCAELSARAGGWTVPVSAAGPDVIGMRIALATNALLIGPDRANIQACGACSWLYLDPSPTKRRRWCSMATCGNRAKARRHYDRSRRPVDPGPRARLS